MCSLGTIAVRAGRWAGRTALVASVVVFGLLVIGPHTGRYRVLTVLTASMRPTFDPGAAVVVVPTPVDDLQVGDVITYAVPVGDHHVVTHRVIEILEPGTIRTMGDANEAPDPWTARLNGGTVWTVRAAVPVLGEAIQALRVPAVRVGSVAGSVVVGTAFGLRRIWRRPASA